VLFLKTGYLFDVARYLPNIDEQMHIQIFQGNVAT